MSGCTGFEKLMEALFAGEAGTAGAARERVLEHAEACRECGELYRFHSWLSREAPALDEPAPGDFAAMRGSVLSRIQAGAGTLSSAARAHPAGRSHLPEEPIAVETPSPGEPGPSRERTLRAGGTAPGRRQAPWWERLLFHPGGTPRPRLAALAAAAAVLIASGWILGRTPLGAGARSGSAARGIPAVAGGPGAGPASAGAITSSGSGSWELYAGPDGLPYQLSNISLEPAGGDRVRLAFDMTRRVRLERAADDPLVKEALVQSLRGSSPLGSRLKAVSVAGDHMDPAVREALIAVMENDPSVAVRLRAAETLSRSPSDPDVQDAMLRVLESEESVAMRLLAVDTLGQSRVGPERVLDILDDPDDDADQAVLVRARQRLGL